MITGSDRTRLEKLLNMLGSDFDGERATAGKMIATMATNYKMTVVQLCLSSVQPPEQPIYQSHHFTQKEYPQPPKQPGGGPAGYRDPGFYDFQSRDKYSGPEHEEYLRKAREKKRRDWERFKEVRDALTFIKHHHAHRLNEWELGFVNNIVDHPPYQTLTEKQFEVARKIIDRVIRDVENDNK